MTGYSIPPGAIVNQIKTLLKERYKEGFPIVKEIVQNANDGDATKLDIGVCKGLKNASHPLLKCPALFFANNGSFSDNDAKAIQWFGADINAGNSGKIGKFGLGQKSIFHFCEAFFYIAPSKLLSNKCCGKFINPWASASGDPKRLEWEELTEKDREIIEKYLMDKKLLDEEYFVLWLPLRKKVTDNRCILPNYYDDRSIQENLPQDMDAKIAALLPMLRSLREVKYWVPNDKGELQQQFHVCLDEKSKRCSYPNSNEENYPPKENYPPTKSLLSGKISLSQNQSQNQSFYGGIEVIIEPEKFSSLLHRQGNTTNFWDSLKKSDYWPKRLTFDENGDNLTVPDKAIPHCAVVFSRKKAREKGSLTLQWAVFLPLVDEKSNVDEFEACECEGEWDYTLMLHGYFFLDSGRRSIEALKDICKGTIPSGSTPTKEDEMIREWNAILATEGTLSNILLALKEFCTQNSLKDDDIEALCRALGKIQIFKNKTLCKKYLYSEFYWIYWLHPKGSKWQLIDKSQRILKLPEISTADNEMWEAFPELKKLAEGNFLILKNKPNLLLSNKSDSWKASEVKEILTKLVIEKVFASIELTNFLYDLLEPFSDYIQNDLKQVFKKVFKSVNNDAMKKAQDSVKKIIKLLDKSKWFTLDSDDEKLLQDLYQVKTDILIVPQNLAPSQNSGQISGKDGALLIECLIKYRKENSQEAQNLIEKIVRAIPVGEKKEFQNHAGNLKFIPGHDYQDKKDNFYSFAELREMPSNNCLFDETNQEYVEALQLALEKETIILVDGEIANKILDDDVEKCDKSACLKVLRSQPKLSTPENRKNLLRKLL